MKDGPDYSDALLHLALKTERSNLKKVNKKYVLPNSELHSNAKVVKESREESNCSKRAGRTLLTFYDRVRGIYRAGPQGEGQKVWRTVREWKRRNKARTQRNQQQKQDLETESAGRIQQEGKNVHGPKPASGPPLSYPPTTKERLHPISHITEDKSAHAPLVHYSHKDKGKTRPCRDRFSHQLTSLRSLDLPLGASVSV